MFWFELSALFRKPVHELMEEITSYEFSEYWVAKQGGLLPDSWLQTGILYATIAQANGCKKAKPEDIIPKLGKKPGGGTKIEGRDIEAVMRMRFQQRKQRDRGLKAWQR